MGKLFHIKTFGCQMNKHDSDSITQILLSKGYGQADSIEKADIILINTCSIRKKAEDKALTLLGRIGLLKRKKPYIVSGIIGCVAQEKGVSLFTRFPYIDLVVGPRNIHRIDEFLVKIGKEREKISSLDLTCGLGPHPTYNGHINGSVSRFLKIMEGCDNFCSYCIVPFVRGREISIPAGDIIDEARYLVNHGVKEITLIGQNVNSYNRKDTSALTFTELLRELDKISDLKRLRFTTSHPKDLSSTLISAFAELRSLCPHIHLPVQSGSNRILKHMNRGYTREQYSDLVYRLRETRPGMSITSDMIVGFPGETKKDFQDSLRLIEELRFDNLFSFKYSERPGTAAIKLSDKVEDEEKQRRLTTLQAMQGVITLSKNKDFEGTTQEILVEGPSRKGNNQLTGRTPGNNVVNFVSDKNLTGKSVMVKITDGYQNSLYGTLEGMLP